MHHIDKYDLFIAYYGNAQAGSEKQAREIYNQIQGAQIAPGKYIRAYFHPFTNPYGSFEETPMIVARTPLFLLVVDRNIPTNDVGQLLRHRKDGSLGNLFEEVQTFHDSVYRNHGDKNVAKLYISDSFDFKAAERLHPIFGGTIALNSSNQVLEWIRHVYPSVHCGQVYRKCTNLINHKREEFWAGKWVAEAEELWRLYRNEPLGRTLLIYHLYHADQGSPVSLRRLGTLCNELRNAQILEDRTCEVLVYVERKYGKYM